MSKSFEEIQAMNTLSSADILGSVMRQTHSEEYDISKVKAEAIDNRNKSLGTITPLKEGLPDKTKMKGTKGKVSTKAKKSTVDPLDEVETICKGIMRNLGRGAAAVAGVGAATLGAHYGAKKLFGRSTLLPKKKKKKKGDTKKTTVDPLDEVEAICKGILSGLGRRAMRGAMGAGGVGIAGKGLRAASRGIKAGGKGLQRYGAKVHGASMARRGVVPTMGTRVGSALQRAGKFTQQNPGAVGGAAVVGGVAGMGRLASKRRRKQEEEEGMDCNTPGDMIRSNGQGRGEATGGGRGPIGGMRENADYECETPGNKIRSKGKGRGLAVGRGKGPIGRRAGNA